MTRAYALAARHPASCAAFDVLEHPDHGPVAARPHTERRALLAEVLQDIGPPIQAIPSTDSRTLAMEWYDVLQAQGLEGVVAKPGRSPTRSAAARTTPTATPRPPAPTPPRSMPICTTRRAASEFCSQGTVPQPRCAYPA
ncbi:hypothetical protein JHN53_15040 [Streptomyces sp. MBT58]|nr:hypothetical protein [Streptomyces sp. MBT58]